MKTVKEVSELTGISIRTLRYYDEINLLKPAKVTEAGYRLYDERSLKKLRQIMFFRELEVPLSEIKAIMRDSESDNRKILETQKMILEMKRNHLNGMIELISDVLKGEGKMSFEAFNEDDIQKIIQHSLEIMSEEDKKIVIGHYGDIEEFKESVAESFKDEKACEHLIKIYGSKEKAVECHASNYSSHLRQIYRRLNSAAPLHYLYLRAVFYGTFFSVLLTILSDSLIVIFATENKKRKNSPDQSSFFLSTPSAVSRFLAGSMS